MLHKPHLRLVKHADKAVLFIHGIAGTPNHFRDLIPLVPEDVSVCALLLDGHGKDVQAFSKTSMKTWLRQVDEAAEMLLATHKELIIAAHSMGTLFAIGQAVKRPEIKKLFLLAVPLKIFVRPSMARDAFCVAFDRVRKEDERAVAAKAACGIAPSKRLWLYLGWIPRYLELFSQIGKTRKLLPALNTSALVFQSRKDEMVSMASCRLLRKCGCVKLHILENSSHHYYAEEDYRFVLKCFKEFI